jgi:hypothetical protein
MAPQLPTAMGTGGELQQTKSIKTRYYYADPRFAYIRRLDVRDELGGSGQSETAALTSDLTKASSLTDAGEKIEEVLAMKVEDVDTSKTVSVYGVDSLCPWKLAIGFTPSFAAPWASSTSCGQHPYHSLPSKLLKTVPWCQRVLGKKMGSRST